MAKHLSIPIYNGISKGVAIAALLVGLYCGYAGNPYICILTIWLASMEFRLSYLLED